MRILLTGNNGYIGTILTEILLKKGYQVVGLDTNYYQGCQLCDFGFKIKQINKDIRKVDKNDLKGIDAVIHLAALSNDPLGEFDPKLTEEINFKATVRLTKLAKEAGVRRFIFVSSCSMYGIAGEAPVTEESPLSPVTAYAVSKAHSEKALLKMADDNFSPIFLRPGTAYGISPMLRCDLVVNNLAGWAFTTGKIRIMSDSTPWRPVIHTEDFSRGIIACLEAPIELIHNQAFNLGQNSENYQIKDLANAVKKIIPGCEVKYTFEHGSDSRTYKVNFDKINTVLKDYFQPKWTIKEGIKQLYEAFKFHCLTLEEFTGNKYIRINELKKLVSEKKLDDNLFWTNQNAKD